ncbi:lipocalin family protein [Spongiibacter tropicus]|uniref:lipocalin family protein n=1 Tax=Spongiibacter tropicus TaxID=454602 RepID=UPI0003B3BB6F|nr:lipocalin family protein [Spongiibacter tropicus]
MRRLVLLALPISLLLACVSPRKALPVSASVDLERFMGDWYVIGFIPLFPERNAHNGIESYALREDGGVAVAYQFRNGSFSSPLKTYRPTAEIVPGTGNAQWKMQFIWPFEADYRIAYVSEDYRETIIARAARDYVWLMARSPSLPEARLQALRKRIAEMGYDMAKFRMQPQQWPEAESRRAPFPQGD